MQMSDKAKLTVEGCYFNRESSIEHPVATSSKTVYMPRGWYKGGVFIGYNYKEALNWLYDKGY